ncbi:MAG: hypothetical protein NWF00_02025 [Candidatus Bathyarchaeota archaeon]|nr:hypothetical protein [Candidatus Bathyarchaeota archaeon]
MKTFLKKFLRDKRAITPIVSELLLIVIAVAAMSVATTATYVITNNLRDNMNERVVVEDVWFNGGTQTIDLYFFNVGTVEISISHVYINHTGVSTAFSLDSNEGGLLSLSYVWSSGQVYYIDAVTNRGTHVAGYYKAV